MNQPQYGMLMNYFSGQTLTPTYTDHIMSPLVWPTLVEQTSLLHTCDRYPLGVLCHQSVLSPMICLTDTCSNGKIGRDRSDRLPSLVRPVHLSQSDRLQRPVRPVLTVILFQISTKYLPCWSLSNCWYFLTSTLDT